MMRPIRITSARALAIAATLLASAAPASAQLPSASARALGLGDNFTALARGYTAVAWNPAGLGMNENPRGSFTLLPVRGVGGVDPVTTSELAEWGGKVVPVEVRQAWLEEIRAEGNQRGYGGSDVTLAAFSAGRFGAQVSTILRGSMNLSPDAAELLLFGNTGMSGEAREFLGAGSDLDVVAATTAAVGYGRPIRIGADGDSRLALGVTVKYTIGHFVMHGEDDGSRLRNDPLEGEIRFPVVHSDSASAGDAGRGMGLDVGLAWNAGPLTVGASVQNVVNTFEWDREKLSWRPGQAFFGTDTTSSDFDAQPIDTAPEGLVEVVDRLGFEPVVSVGAVYDASAALKVTADFRHHLGDGVRFEPQTHLGAGVEFRPLRFLPLRAGAAAVSGGYQLSGGLGLELGVFNLTAAAAQRDTDLGADAIGMFSLSFGTN